MQAGLAQAGLRREKRRRLVILDGVSGVLHPGRMTLLLGPPSSGKSTLLKVLAGLQASNRNLKVRLVFLHSIHNHVRNGNLALHFEPNLRHCWALPLCLRGNCAGGVQGKVICTVEVRGTAICNDRELDHFVVQMRVR